MEYISKNKKKFHREGDILKGHLLRANFLREALVGGRGFKDEERFLEFPQF